MPPPVPRMVGSSRVVRTPSPSSARISSPRWCRLTAISPTPCAAQERDRVADERDVADRQQRLGALVGERAETRAEAGGEDERARHGSLHELTKRRSSTAPTGLGVERLRPDPGDHAALGQAAHVSQAAHQQRFAQPLAAMRGVGAGGAEPAEALVVAVGGGEGDRRDRRCQRDVDGAARAVERAADLEGPHRRERRCAIQASSARSIGLVDATDRRSPGTSTPRRRAGCRRAGARMFSTLAELAEAARGEEGARRRGSGRRGPGDR